MERSRTWQRTAFAAMLAALYLTAPPAKACEPVHDLLHFGDPIGGGLIVCEPGATYCKVDGQGQPIFPCIACEVTGSSKLCWASECRGFNGDTGQFGQFKKDVPGELQAIVMTVENLRTGETTVLVDKIASPTCSALIPTPSANLSCSKLYKVKDIRPIGGSAPGPLCTFDNLDDVNTIVRTPASQNVVLTDVNGRQCAARKRAGDQWWMFYQTCCTPLTRFGEPGDPLDTRTELIVDRGNGNCVASPVRPGRRGPQIIPLEPSAPCL